MIYAVSEDREFLPQLTRIARRSPTQAAQRVWGGASLGELLAAAADDPQPCVLAAPGADDDPLDWLRVLRRRLRSPRVILLLPHDDPRLACDLLLGGAFDLAYRYRFSPSHLLAAVSHAADGARRPPYGAVCPTHEFNPCPGLPWAVVFREAVAAPTDRLDGDALRALPRALRLGPDALLSLEVLAPSLPDLLEMPSLVLALLSAEPPSDGRRADFLAAMRGLEQDRRRVLYVSRAGAALSADAPADLLPARDRLIRPHSAVEMLLVLHFGFGGACAA